jgi:hypothetical protein
MQITKDTGSLKVAQFDSWGQFVQQAVAAPDHNAKDDSHKQDGDWWHGTKTFGEAVELANNGWPKGAERALQTRAVVERIVGFQSGRSQKWDYELVGDVVDIGRYLTGEPEHWLTEDTGDAHQGRVVKIVANVSISCGVSVESIFRRGACIATAVDAIEAAGKRCEVWLAYGAKTFGGGLTVQFFVPVKLASQPLDQDRIAYAICHAASSRRLCFSIQAQLGAPASTTCPSEVEVEEGTIYLPSGYWKDGYNTDESIRELVSSICEKAGILAP